MSPRSDAVPPLGRCQSLCLFIWYWQWGGVSHLIKDSYLFNNLCVALHQHRRGDITLFMGPHCCRVNNALYKKCNILLCQLAASKINVGCMYSQPTHTHASFNFKSMFCYILEIVEHFYSSSGLNIPEANPGSSLPTYCGCIAEDTGKVS